MDYSRLIDRLITRQMRDWDEASRNYAELAGVATRMLDLGDSTVVLQFNPERRRSSAAAIDKKSLARRECFLCSEHQPAKQKVVFMCMDWQETMQPTDWGKSRLWPLIL